MTGADIPQLAGQAQGTIDTGLNEPISMLEIKAALVKAKDGKAQGFDEIPVEVVINKSAVMFNLFNACFSSGIVPSAWSKCIINPIPNCSNSDPRVPGNYSARGQDPINVSSITAPHLHIPEIQECMLLYVP